MYKKEELKEFSTNELVKYVKGFYEIMLDNPSDSNLFEYINDLYVYWINRDVHNKIDNETAYHMYLDFLNLTNHYYEAYDVCNDLIKKDMYKAIVYKKLIDYGYVGDGVISFDEHLDYLRRYIDICQDIEEKESLKDLLAYEENLWK